MDEVDVVEVFCAILPPLMRGVQAQVAELVVRRWWTTLAVGNAHRPGLGPNLSTAQVAITRAQVAKARHRDSAASRPYRIVSGERN